MRRCGHEMEQNLAASSLMPPAGDHRLTRLASAQPPGNPIDVEADDPVLGRTPPTAAANPGRIKSSERTGERRLSATRLPVLDK